jgi:hypothetical protein
MILIVVIVAMMILLWVDSRPDAATQERDGRQNDWLQQRLRHKVAAIASRDSAMMAVALERYHRRTNGSAWRSLHG